jgi:hypothetical protein
MFGLVRVASQYFQRELISWPSAHASSQRVGSVNVLYVLVMYWHMRVSVFVLICVYVIITPRYIFVVWCQKTMFYAF